MVLSSVLLPYLLVAPVVLALHLPGSPPPPRGALADRHGLDSTSVTKRFVSTNLEANLTYVENSGVCETTPGVHQVSGYVTVGKYMHMWFWFFAARKSPETASFTLWLNGGPGCPSMIGLLQEHGPCLVNADRATTVNNPYSWNEVSNMIYVDQPIGTGFSYGIDTATSTKDAAPFVWRAFQILFESQLFSQYQSRQFNLATESYGGHYGPEFVSYFLEQNSLIDRGSLPGAVKINFYALLIGNGWIDPIIQYKAYIDFAANAPGYGPLASDSDLQKMNASFYGPNGCLEQEQTCYAGGDSTTAVSVNTACNDADIYCWNNIRVVAIGDRDGYDLRQNSTAAFPPEYYISYLDRTDVISAIGAESSYSRCPADKLQYKFTQTGDHARTVLPELAKLVDSGLKVLIWAGDTDIVCNWVGVYETVKAMEWWGKAALASTPLTNMTISGKVVAAIQNIGNFSFARVYEAGHEVPAFQPAASLEIFKQIIEGKELHSV